MTRTLTEIIILAAIALPSVALGLPPGRPDPCGILIKPIPDKLVVLTFDDGPASGYTVVAPILKSFGFNGSFYICDFDSFSTRKDWYLTWRQMKAMADDGFEIGNHTRGHGGGSPIGPFLDMEDQLLANGVPKPTTIAWPVYRANTSTYPHLAANGYTFGRGGHFRPYRPTVDNPFDVPSMGAGDMETFVKNVRQATGGRIVVLTFHGVPDMEHPAVGLEPATFKVMMQYLKDNNYKVIALRDLAEYIDPVKAAKLPPTSRNVKKTGPAKLAAEDKSCVAKDILSFVFPGLGNGRIIGPRISATVPYAADVAALAPNIAVSARAVVAPASGTARDFTAPQAYTVTGRDGATKTYTVTVKKAAVGKDKDILTFVLPGQGSAAISGTRIGVYVRPATDVTALAPAFTLSPFAKAVPASGTARDFTRPQTYTITAQDGSSRVVTVKVVKSDKPNAFTWKNAAAGKWSDGAKWSNNLADGSAPLAAGLADYTINLNEPGNYTVTNDLNEGFALNQLNFNGPSAKVEGKALAFVADGAAATRPRISQNARGEATIGLPVKLAADVTVDATRNGRLILEGLVSGSGSLTKNGQGQLRITNAKNTYRGGTIVNGGSLMMLLANEGLGSGPITLNGGASLDLEHVDGTNPLILNGGTIHAGNGFGDSWNGDITLNGDIQISSYADFLLNNKSGGISGPGGITQVGSRGGFGMVNSGTVSLCGTNTYTGATTVRLGTLRVLKTASLYNGDAASWTPANISVATAATLRISAGGPGEFSGAQVAALLRNLTTAVNYNGLMAGAVFSLDTSNATDTVTVSLDIADSKGPGGGAFILKKCGAGTLRLSGKNTYAGRTILEGGSLSISSLNSFVRGKPSSNLGAPTDVEAGEIVIGRGDGECALIYTGTGETTDRVMNLAGKKSTVTFDQSGTGLLKLTSTFVISGYGTSKTVLLKGDTAGSGEIAGDIVNPYDRAGKATTAVTKSGSGTWTLSGSNSYTGPTLVTKGTLSIANERSLGPNTDVIIDAGATLELNFKGQMRVGKLTLNGKQHPAGAYSATNAPAFIKGTGILIARQ